MTGTAAGGGMNVGFLGLGLMGEPMALNLARAGTPLVVWNRSPAKTESLRTAGARVAATTDEVFRSCDVVFEMLADEAAIDAVLGRHLGPGADLRERTLVHMGTTSPGYSSRLESAVRATGGRYVEAPVSGSRLPAQRGQLVAMLAGEPAAVETVRPLLAPMCRDAVPCGEVPGALVMKLAVNLYLITMVTGLVETVHFATAHRLDLGTLAAVLDAGPMASDVSTVKLDKLLRHDFAAQAALADVLKNSRLVADAAGSAMAAAPLLELCRDLYAEAVDLGHGGADMVAVIRALEGRDRAPATG